MAQSHLVHIDCASQKRPLIFCLSFVTIATGAVHRARESRQKHLEVPEMVDHHWRVAPATPFLKYPQCCGQSGWSATLLLGRCVSSSDQQRGPSWARGTSQPRAHDKSHLSTWRRVVMLDGAAPLARNGRGSGWRSLFHPGISVRQGGRQQKVGGMGSVCNCTVCFLLFFFDMLI